MHNLELAIIIPRHSGPLLYSSASLLLLDNSYEAAGLGAYSDSKAIALSYASIFDILWKQTQLYEKLSETYEQLKIHNRMQKGFLDIDEFFH